MTACVRGALKALLAGQRKAMAEAYMQGNARTEAERMALLMAEAFVEDMFESTADDYKATMERFDEE